MPQFSKVLAATIIVCFCWVGNTLAQISAGGTPPSFSLSLTSTAPTAQMAPVDAQAYLAEDEQTPKDEPYRFAAVLDVSLNLQNSGVWENLPDGGRLWRLQIYSPAPFSLCLSYDQWYLPDGAQLFIYNADQSQIIGAFTSFNNWVDGTNITQHVASDVSILELYEPADVYGQSVLSISHVAHAYRNLFGAPGALDNYGDSGTCNNNVNCPEGANWQTNKRGVAMITLSNGSRICTGSLVNNTAQNQTPYFLTANHCLGGNNTWIFVFNYESPGCPNQNGPTNQTVANSTLRANNSASDFALLQLSANVPAGYNPYFNGWNRVDAAATNSVCIHHPSGDIKKITFDNNAPVSSTWAGTPANSHWRILNWEDGTTEPGSSGSPLFDQNHRITGQLHGGTASCSNNIDDYFGKFSMSWAQGGSAATRLRDWLDPGNSGVNTLDGLDGGGPSITVTSPNGAEIWIDGTAHNITWTSSGVAGNVNIELNRSYSGGAWEAVAMNTANDGTHSWTVTAPATSAARIRITSVDNGAISDVSNANFTISIRTITVTVPNGGENWIEGLSQNITWTSSNMSGNVNIDLNRSYPGGAWESIAANTANDGTQPWTVSLPATGIARVRIIAVSYPAVGDTSNGNFTIAARTITVLSPNGGEVWIQGSLQNVTWTSSNVTGNVNVELNRTYSGGAWETIALNTTNDGTQPWTVTLPASTLARVRVTSVSFPTVSDVSNNNFTITGGNQPPVIVHDPLDDQLVQPFMVTAIVTDDAGGFVTKMRFRPVGGVNYDSLTLASTGNPNEYSVTVNGLAQDQYEYFLRVRDVAGLTAQTAQTGFEIGDACGSELFYDDGSAEASHWSETVDYKWAVKFEPSALPFALCNGRIGISAENPDNQHALLTVEVFAADGLGDLPGTLLFSKTIGSIGNVIGGVPINQDNWCDVVFRDAFGNPLSINGDFYVAVANPVGGIFEAFLHDESAAYSGNSFVYDPCDLLWYNENDVDESCRLGNRLIRASGFPLTAPVVVIHRVGDDIQLNWASTGAPYYQVYSSTNPSGPFSTFEGSTATNSFLDLAPLATLAKFYVVQASTSP